jgi:hypothetical protein
MIASDAFTAPLNFAEFAERYPNYLSRYTLHRTPDATSDERLALVGRLEAQLSSPVADHLDRVAACTASAERDGAIIGERVDIRRFLGAINFALMAAMRRAGLQGVQSAERDAELAHLNWTNAVSEPAELLTC